MSDRRRIDTLAALVRDGMYPIDATVIAEAIDTRRRARSLIVSSEFRSDSRDTQVRSFRATRSAPSFRLAHGGRRR